MQNTISFTHKKKNYVSKPFDFKALCLINDKHVARDKDGELQHSSIYVICADAVDYLFEGTEADQRTIDALPLVKRAELCRDVWDIYLSEMTAKNDEAAAE